MNHQTSFAQSEYARKKKTTRRERFLAQPSGARSPAAGSPQGVRGGARQMEAVVPWARLVAVLAPHDPAGRRIFAEVGALLVEKRLLMREGTLIAATLIAAPSSTKNRRRERDPAMRQTEKGVLFALANLYLVRRQWSAAAAA